MGLAQYTLLSTRHFSCTQWLPTDVHAGKIQLQNVHHYQQQDRGGNQDSVWILHRAENDPGAQIQQAGVTHMLN